MSLAIGDRLGSYEILSALGAGGMGEVYRARDSKLNRDVALKLLPDAFARDPERVARFEREAQLLATLNHTNIGAIYGLDEAPSTRSGQAAVRFLVLELIDGESLSQRLSRGAMPVDEALAAARQIIDALEAAHEKGIVHRDLKPGNIMLTADGQVKVLDFGLAKALGQGSGIGDRGSGGAAESPTITSPAAMTQAGMILGTAAYMSPEQAKGRVTDKRSDVWAFGCVVFEMLTARRAFEGEDVTDTLAAIVRGEPDWAALPKGVPAHITAMVKRCLAKDRRARIPDLSVARFMMDEGATAAAPGAPVTAPSASRRSPAFAAALVIVTAGVAALATWALTRPAPLPSPHPARFAVTAAGFLLLPGNNRDLSLSPDGQRIVYVTGMPTSGSDRLWVRPIDALDAVEIKGVNSPRSPFVSPDNRWVGYLNETGVASGELKKVSITGGPPVLICRMPSIFYGATWGADDSIVFASADGLFRVPAGGGEPVALLMPTKGDGYRFPTFLPGDHAVLFTIVQGGQQNLSQDRTLDPVSDIAALDLKTGRYKTLIRGGTHPDYLGEGASGFLTYAAAGSLRAVRFDPVRLEVLGDAVPVVDQVVTKFTGAAEYSVSRQGALAYVAGEGVAVEVHRTLVWVGRDGREEAIKAAPRAYQRARISPDGTRIALDVRDQENDIWTWDIAHEALMRLTIDRAADSYPLWSRDGKRIIFSSTRNGAPNLYAQAADGTGAAERLSTSPGDQVPLTISTDGAVVIRGASGDKRGLSIVRPGDGAPAPLFPSSPATP